MLRILFAAIFVFSATVEATEIIMNGNCHITVTSPTGVTIDPATGNLIADGTYGSGCPSGTTGGGTTGTTPQITTALHSDQDPAAAGTSFTLSWTTSNVDNNCTTAGSSFPAGASFGSLWPTSGTICTGSACATGSVTLTTSIVGTYNFQLHCYRNGVTAPADSALSLSVGTGSSSSCAGVAPSGLTRQTIGTRTTVSPVTSSSVDLQHYENVFGYDPTMPTAPLADWPGRNVVYGIRIQRNQYVALQFTVPSDAGTSRSGNFYRQQTNTEAPSSWTISTCPGDFRTSALAAGCYVNLSSKGGFFWATGAVPGYCQLQPGQTYYLNIVNAALATPTTTRCNTNSCNVEVTNQVF